MISTNVADIIYARRNLTLLRVTRAALLCCSSMCKHSRSHIRHEMIIEGVLLLLLLLSIVAVPLCRKLISSSISHSPFTHYGEGRPLRLFHLTRTPLPRPRQHGQSLQNGILRTMYNHVQPRVSQRGKKTVANLTNQKVVKLIQYHFFM